LILFVIILARNGMMKLFADKSVRYNREEIKKIFNNQSGFVLIHFIIQIFIATILIYVAVIFIQKYGFINLLISVFALIIIGLIFYFITVVYERVTKRSWDDDQQKIYTIIVVVFMLGGTIYFVLKHWGVF
jgi:hypothetical protein